MALTFDVSDSPADRDAVAQLWAEGSRLLLPRLLTTAEVRYVGVIPRAWGGGVGTRLMTELRSALAGAGYERAELMAYLDNSRALRLYERQGWSADGDPTPHPRTGKLEQRYTLTV